MLILFHTFFVWKRNRERTGSTRQSIKFVRGNFRLSLKVNSVLTLHIILIVCQVFTFYKIYKSVIFLK